MRATVEVNKTKIDEVNELKTLGFIVTCKLIWTVTAKTRSPRALKAFYSVKTNITKKNIKAYKTTSLTNRLLFDCRLLINTVSHHKTI